MIIAGTFPDKRRPVRPVRPQPDPEATTSGEAPPEVPGPRSGGDRGSGPAAESGSEAEAGQPPPLK